jgi:hypothetical protein
MVDALVLVEKHRRLPVLAGDTQLVGAAALASGFLAGITTFSLLHSRRRRAATRGRRRRSARRPQGAEDLLQIVASRSLLVDIHLLGSGRGR